LGRRRKSRSQQSSISQNHHKLLHQQHEQLPVTLVSLGLAQKPSKKVIVEQTKEVLREEGEDVRVKEVENLVQVDEEKGGGKE